MVVLDCGFGEFEVAIECNGRILQEYASGPVSATRQQCHIASEENKTFAVLFQPRFPRLHHHSIDVYIDGTPMYSTVVDKDVEYTSFRIEHTYASASHIRQFYFKKAETKEDERNDDDIDYTQKSLINMATIRVKLTPATRKKMAAPRNTKKDPDPIREIKLPGDDPISEKQKKGGAHVSGLGEPIPIKRSKREKRLWVTSSPLPNFLPQGEIVCKTPDSTVRLTTVDRLKDVVFHYAPFDMLKAREIIPQDASPQSQSVQPAAASKSTSSKGKRTRERPAKSDVEAFEWRPSAGDELERSLLNNLGETSSRPKRGRGAKEDARKKIKLEYCENQEDFAKTLQEEDELKDEP